MIFADINLSRNWDQGSDYYNLSWKLDIPGYYEGSIKYGDSTMGLKNIQIFCLTGQLCCIAARDYLIIKH